MRALAGLALGGLLVGAAWALRRRYATTSLTVALRDAVTEVGEITAAVREGMAEREAQLRAAIGLDVAPGTAPLDRQAVPLDDAAGPRASRSGSA